MWAKSVHNTRAGEAQPEALEEGFRKSGSLTAESRVGRAL